MAYINQIPLQQAVGETKQLYQSAAGRAGEVANIIQVMSQHGPTAIASMGFYAMAMKSENALTVAQREMLATVVSNANDCFY